MSDYNKKCQELSNASCPRHLFQTKSGFMHMLLSHLSYWAGSHSEQVPLHIIVSDNQIINELMSRFKQSLSMIPGLDTCFRNKLNEILVL